MTQTAFHTHTCIDCHRPILCVADDPIGCTSEDGDGRCARCAEVEYDRIGDRYAPQPK